MIRSDDNGKITNLMHHKNEIDCSQLISVSTCPATEQYIVSHDHIKSIASLAPPPDSD